MANLYDKVRKPDENKRSGRDPWAIILPLIAVIVLIAVILAVYYWIYLDDLFYDFVADLSESTVTINDTKIIPMEIDGDDSYVLKTTKAYGLYNKLTVSKQFRLVDETPTSGGIHIDYPDGSSLSIWYTDIDVATWTRSHGILVEYTDKDGDVFRFITDRVIYSDLVYYLTH